MSDNDIADPYALVPELGDLLTIESEIYKTTTGRIIYRDGALIRVKPTHLSNKAVNFPLDAESGLFREALGVSEIIMHEKARDPHFAVQLAVFPGERLEFYSIEGDPVAEEGVVRTVIANDTEDAIELEDGRRLDFGFVGPQPPVDVIVQRAALDDVAQPENNGATDEEIDLEEEVFPEIDYDLLPSALVEEIPTSERTYSDSVQREDMFVSLLLDVPVAQQKNPRILRNLYRKTDVLLALKNSIVVRDETGGVDVGMRQSYQASTLREALLKQPTGAPLAALMPVAAVKKVLYTDDGMLDGAAAYRDVSVRQDVLSLTEAQILNDQFRASGGLDERGGGNPFLTYLDALLRRQMPAYVPALEDPADPKIQVDQDVLRSSVPMEPVEVLGAGLPPAVVLDTGRRAKVRESDPTQLNVAAHLTQIPMPEPVRLLAASRYRNPNTGQTFQMAPADTGATVGHVVLSAPLTALRLPTRSSVLLWDIDASEASRAATQSFYAALRRTWEAQRVIGVPEEGGAAATDNEEASGTVSGLDLSVIEELEARVSPCLQIAARPVVQTLDALGFRNLEIDGPMLDVLVKAMEAGRLAWDSAFAAMQDRVIKALEKKEAAPQYPYITDEDPLWSEGVRQETNMVAALEAFAARETSLEMTGMARALFFAASDTLRTLWWSLAGGVSADALAAVTETYVGERRRAERAEANALAAEAALAAQPAVNECPHVYLLESIRSIRDEAKRMRLLEDFVTKYRSGTQGNWVLCGSCNQHLVCRHELALLHEFTHPGRGVAIHKALLLEFGGPVFEGAYICKSCGQKIADLEYDTSLEFDDEGRPLVGRTIVEPDEAKDELALAAATEEEGVLQDTHGFTGADELSMFYLVRYILEFCGITPDTDMYRRVVHAALDYMKYKMPPELVWEANRKTEAGRKRFPPYASHKANSKLAVIGALATLEILTTDVSVPFPLHGCKFVRGGFPLETEGTGTMTYVACVIAGILRLDEPWTATTWVGETNLEKRKNAVFEDIQRAMVAVLAIQPATGRGPTPLTGVTEMYKTALQVARDRRLQADFDEGVSGASRADRLPPAFRPLPYMSPLSAEEEPAAVTNVGSFENSVKTAPVTEIGPVVTQRMEALTRSHVSHFHTAALASAKELMVLSASSPRSDSTCCFQRLGAVAAQGLGVASLVQGLGDASVAEAQLLVSAAATVRRRDPTVGANGTHMYVPWSAPHQITHAPQADASVYYRLFLKHCFRGPNLGGVHEIDESNICRRCHFEMPAEFRFLTVSEIAETDGKRLEKALAAQNEERQALALRAFADQGVLIDETSFRQLEDAIHQRKSLPTPVVPTTPDMVSQLEMLGAQITDSPLLTSAIHDWQLLVDFMASVGRQGLAPTDPKRRTAFSRFVERYDAMREGVQKRMGMLSGTSAAKQEAVRLAFEGLDMLTKDVEAAQAVMNLRAALVITGEQVVKGFKNVNPRVTKWFPRVNRSHAELLTNIWRKQAALTERAQAGLEVLRPVAQPIVKSLLDRMMAWMGAFLKTWISDIRTTDAGFSASEYQYVLRWLVTHVMAALLTDESGLYRDVAADVRRQVQLFFTEWFIDVFKTAGRQVAEFQMSAKEIQDAILARTELEKRAFINKFDQLDREMRRIELEKKKLKIGDWAVGTVKNLFSYDADFYEFERGQRAAMGLPEFAAGVDGAAGAAGAAAEDPYGFFQFGQQPQADGAYDHRARHDEDE